MERAKEIRKQLLTIFWNGEARGSEAGENGQENIGCSGRMRIGMHCFLIARRAM